MRERIEISESQIPGIGRYYETNEWWRRRSTARAVIMQRWNFVLLYDGRYKHHDWIWGRVESGETIRATMARELCEEVGVSNFQMDDNSLPTIVERHARDRCIHISHFFLICVCTSTDIVLRENFSPGTRIDSLAPDTLLGTLDSHAPTWYRSKFIQMRTRIIAQRALLISHSIF